MPVTDDRKDHSSVMTAVQNQVGEEFLLDLRYSTCVS